MDERSIAAVNVLKDSTDAMLRHVVDGGRFVEDLNAVGMRLAVTFASSYSTGEVIVVSGKDAGLSMERGIKVEIGQFGAVRNHVVPPFKWDTTGALPILNSNEVKTFAGSKRNVLGAYPDLAIETQFLDSESVADIALEALYRFASQGGEVIVKPDRGSASKGLQIFGVEEARAWLEVYHAAAPEERQVMLMQPRVKMTIHSGVKGVGEDAEQNIKALRENGARAVEMRCYAIRNSTGLTIVPILRVGAEGEGKLGTKGEQYFDISLSDELYQQVHTIVTRVTEHISDQTGAAHLLGAVDIVALPGDNLRLMEANFRAPGVRSTRQVQSARRVFKAIAGTLKDMSNSNG